MTSSSPAYRAAKEADDGGPAFPCSNEQFTHGNPASGDAWPGLSLRDWFATHAPAPTEGEIETQYKLDKMRNPYNEPRKPTLRGRARIRADLAFEYADAMLAARDGGKEES